MGHIFSLIPPFTLHLSTGQVFVAVENPQRINWEGTRPTSQSDHLRASCWTAALAPLGMYPAELLGIQNCDN